MALVEVGNLVGIMPGLLQAGRLVIQKEVFFKPTGFQQALEQVAGQLQQPQAVADLPMHLEAEDREHQDCQDAEQKGQDDFAPDFVSGFFHWRLFAVVS